MDDVKTRFETLHMSNLEALQRQREQKKRRREDEAAPEEDVEEFERCFAEQIREIQLTLEALERGPEASQICEGLKEKLLECSEALSLRAHFLHPYVIKQSQTSIQTTQDLIAKRQQDLAPRKKFAFSKVQKATKKVDTLAVEEPRVQMTLEGVQGRVNETIVVSAAELSESNCFQLKDCQKCEIILPSKLKALHILRLTACKVYVGVVEGAAHITDCVDSSISVAAHQLRIHTSHNCQFYVFTGTGPIVESVSNAGFAPYNFTYDGAEAHLAEAGLVDNKWDDVQDFKWLKKEKSPNWSVIQEAERTSKTFRLN
mmetsp:Transcript_1182/g.2878  ORF Transcript_1182/g.2878 Transcript_1182/m.2878 type:complete len:315 (+) Transcript_1182:12-956(+)